MTDNTTVAYMQLLRVSAENRRTLAWLVKAMSKDDLSGSNRAALNGISVYGNYLVCADGFRIHAVELPDPLAEDMPHKALLFPKTSFSKEHVGFEVRAQPSGTPRFWDITFPEREHVATVAVDPKLLADAVSGYKGMVLVGVYKTGGSCSLFLEEGKEQNIGLVGSRSRYGKTVLMMGMHVDKDRLLPKTARALPAPVEEPKELEAPKEPTLEEQLETLFAEYGRNQFRVDCGDANDSNSGNSELFVQIKNLQAAIEEKEEENADTNPTPASA